MWFDDQKAVSRGAGADGDVSSLGEIWRSTERGQQRIDNHNSWERQLEEQYDLVGDEIKRATGAEFANPYRSAFGPGTMSGFGVPDEDEPDINALYRSQLDDLERKHPDALDWASLRERPYTAVARAMREAETFRSDVAERRGLIDAKAIPLIGAVPLVREFVAGGANIIRDPAAMGTMFAASLWAQRTSPLDLGINIAAGVAGSPAKSLLVNALRNATANAAAQALLEPGVQMNRARAGLEAGPGMALDNIAQAFGIGAALDFGVRAPGRSVARVINPDVERGGLFTSVPERPTIDISRETVDKAVAGDLAAMRELAAKTGIDQDPKVKGALDHYATVGQIDEAARIAAEKFGTDNVETLAKFQKMAEATVDPSLATPIRGPDPLAEPAGRMVPDEALDVAGRYAAELDAIDAGLRAKLKDQDAQIPVLIRDAFEAGFAEVVPLVREAAEAIRAGKAADGVIDGLTTRAIALMADPMFAARVAIQSGRMDDVGVARLFRDNPALSDRTTSGHGDARALAALSDDAFALVERSEAPGWMGVEVADHVPGPLQADMIGKLQALGVTEPMAARRALAELLPPDVARSATVLGLDPDALPKRVDGLTEPVDGPRSKGARDQVKALEDGLAADIAEARAAGPGSPPQRTLAESLRAANDAMEAIDTALGIKRAQELAGRVLPDGSRVDVVDAPMVDDVTGRRLDAQVDSVTGRVQLAAKALNPDARIGHEAVHVLVTRGLISPDEVAMLAARAEALGVFSAELRETYRAAYAGRGLDDVTVARMLREEAAAHVIEAKIKGKSLDAPAETVVQKVLNVLRRIAVELGARGFRTADDVARALLRGEMAKRAAVQAWMRENDVTAVAVKPDAKPTPPEAMFAFAGEKARTADLEALARAKAMTADGVDRAKVWTDTGWFRGVDGKWRFEIDDSKSDLDLKGAIEDGWQPGQKWPFDHLLNHKALFSAYPAIAETNIQYRPFPDDINSAAAAYGARGNIISLNSGYRDFGNDGAMRSSALHEGQHRIQAGEGFQRGGSSRSFTPDELAAERARLMAIPEDASGWGSVSNVDGDMSDLDVGRSLYRRLAGEVEARTVEKRLDLTPEQRRARPPWLDYDVPEDQQIVRFGGDTSNAMFAIADVDTGRSMRRDLDQLGYFSAALEAAKSWPMTKGTPEQVIAHLKKSGVKDAEIEAVGLKAWMDAKGAKTYYHGSHTKIDKQLRPSELDDMEPFEAVFLAPTRKDAEHYAQTRGGAAGGSIQDVSVRPKKTFVFDISSPETAEASFKGVDPEHDGANPFVGNTQGQSESTYRQNRRFMDLLKQDGYDSVSIVRNGTELEFGVFDANIITDGKPSLTRDDLVAFLEGNRVKLTESVYGAGDTTKADMQRRLNAIDDRLAEMSASDDIPLDAVRVGPANDQNGRVTFRVRNVDEYDTSYRVAVSDGIVTVYDGHDIRNVETTFRLANKDAGPAEIGHLVLTNVRRKYDDIGPPLSEMPGGLERGRLMAEQRDLQSRLEGDMTEEAYLREPERAPKWSAHSLDPSNPSYRETVLHLPESAQRATRKELEQRAVAKYGQRWIEKLTPTEMDELEAATKAAARTDFHSGHFDEPNIIGHMMTSMVKHEGRPVYLIDQIQSDWGQKLRDGGVRDEAKIAELEKRVRDIEAAADGYIMGAPAELVRRAYPDADIDRGVPRVTYWLERLARDDKADGDLREMASEHRLDIDRLIAPMQLADAELRTAKAATPGNPLVNTTDQWTTTTLRRALRQAAEADAAYIAIPHGDTVLSYNPGDRHGMNEFYGKIVPKNLRNILQKLDKSIPPPQMIKEVETPSGMRSFKDPESTIVGSPNYGFTLFPLTDTVKAKVREEGQAMFAIRGGDQTHPDLMTTLAPLLADPQAAARRIASGDTAGVEATIADAITAAADQYGTPLDPARVQSYTGEAMAVLADALNDPAKALADGQNLAQRIMDDLAPDEPVMPTTDTGQVPTPLQRDLYEIDRMSEIAQFAAVCRL